jgi:methylase of polypeptide subunit release factors
MEINPESTIYFRNQIKRESEKGVYPISVNCVGKNISLKIFPEVFPPQKEFLLGEFVKNFPDLANAEVADIGTGSVIEAISAALFRARHIDAIDINPEALKCSKENAQINKVDAKITFILSDLFTKIESSKKYDLILANLPFIDFDGGKDLIDLALYDNNHIIHKNFLAQAKKHLTDNGRILLPHANLQSGKRENSNADFDGLEKMIIDAGYELQIIAKKPFRTDYKWRLYELRIK